MLLQFRRQFYQEFNDFKSDNCICVSAVVQWEGIKDDCYLASVWYKVSLLPNDDISSLAAAPQPPVKDVWIRFNGD